MGRTIGAKNLVEFQKRTIVETSPNNRVRHLSSNSGSPSSDFQALLKHQENFLKWVDSRHRQLVKLSEENKQLQGKPRRQGPTGAKEGTFVKYRWYVEQLVLLEAINAFETFYKRTFVGLGTILRDYVDADQFKDVKIDAALIWTITGQFNAPALMFEQSLYHDLEAIDKCSKILVGERRYNQKSPKPNMKNRVRALRGIFQIRHTLSHNNGYVTDGDSAKFKRFGFSIANGEIIDPAKNELGLAVFRELGNEATDFTDWLAQASTKFLNALIVNAAATIPNSKRSELETLLGAHPCWAQVSWT